MKTVKNLGSGFYLLVITLLFTIAAFIMHLSTFEAFHYELDRYVISLLIIVFWCLICVIISSLFNHKESKILDILYLLAIFALTIGFIKFIIPCISPIGIYFTVNNMGDVEANAIGVPRCLITSGLFLISIITLIISSFLKKRKEEDYE